MVYNLACNKRNLRSPFMVFNLACNKRNLRSLFMVYNLACNKRNLRSVKIYRFKDLSTVYRNYLGYAYHDEMVGASYKNRPFPLECVDLSYSI